MPKIANYTARHDEAIGNERKWIHDENEYIRILVTKQQGKYSEEWDREHWKVEIWNEAHMTELGQISHNRAEMRELP